VTDVKEKEENPNKKQAMGKSDSEQSQLRMFADSIPDRQYLSDSLSVRNWKKSS
jgi:hypothetical protein